MGDGLSHERPRQPWRRVPPECGLPTLQQGRSIQGNERGDFAFDAGVFAYGHRARPTGALEIR